MGALTNWVKDSRQQTVSDTTQTKQIEKREREHNRISPKAEMRDAILLVPDEDVEIHGRWVGDGAKIHCHTLSVEKGAYVEGDIQAHRIRVIGHLKGEVVTTYLVVQEGATVEGVMKCRSMNVSNNSRVRAHIACDNNEGPAAEQIPGNELLDIRTPRLVAAVASGAR